MVNSIGVLGDGTSIQGPVAGLQPAAARRGGLAPAAARRNLVHVRAALIVGVLALALRLVNITRSYELFVGEIGDAEVSRNLAAGRGLTFLAQPYAFHLPALYGIDAVVVDVLGLHGSTDHFVLSLRPVSAVFGALVCVGAYLLVERAAGRRLASIAGLLLAMDPFAISYDSLVGPGAPAGAAAMAVFGLAAGAHTVTGRRRRALIALSGLMTAAVLTTEDTFGLVVMSVLLVLIATGWVLRRREVLVVMAVGVSGYLVSLVALAASGGLSKWWSVERDELLRPFGVRRTAGLAAPAVHVSVLSHAAAGLGDNATSSIVLALGPIAVVVLLWSTQPWRRDWTARAGSRERAVVLVAVWTGIAAVYLLSATVTGSGADEMRYILLGPSLCAVVVAVAVVGAHPVGVGPPGGREGDLAVRPRAARRDGARLAAPRPSLAIVRLPVGATLDAPRYRRPPARTIRRRYGRRGPADWLNLCALVVIDAVADLVTPLPLAIVAGPASDHRRSNGVPPGPPKSRSRPQRRVPARRPRSALRTCAAAVMVVAVFYNGFVWGRVHTTASNGYTRFLAWSATHLPRGSTGSVTDGAAQLLLSGVVIGDWTSLEELKRHRAQWVVVSVRRSDEGATASPAFLGLLERDGKLLYSSTQPVGLRVYGVQALTASPHAASPHAASPHAASPHAASPHAASPHAVPPDVVPPNPLPPRPRPRHPHPSHRPRRSPRFPRPSGPGRRPSARVSCARPSDRPHRGSAGGTTRGRNWPQQCHNAGCGPLRRARSPQKCVSQRDSSGVRRRGARRSP